MNGVVIIETADELDYIISQAQKYTEMPNCFAEIGRGGNAVVYGYKQFAIKKYGNRFCEDEMMLKAVQGSAFYPKLYAYCPERFMIVEKIDGPRLTDYDGEVNRGKLEEALWHAYAKGVMPEDVHEENIIMDSAGNPVIVDVGAYCGNKHISEREAKRIFDCMIDSLDFPGKLTA